MHSKKQIKNRTSDYVCFDCGRLYLTPQQIKNAGVVTAHTGECGLCHQAKSITHIRAFNYLQLPKK